MHPTITQLQGQLTKLRSDESVARRGDLASDKLRADGLAGEIKKLEATIKSLVDQSLAGSRARERKEAANRVSEQPKAHNEFASEAAIAMGEIKQGTDIVDQKADALAKQEKSKTDKSVILPIAPSSTVAAPAKEVSPTKKIPVKKAKKTAK